MTDFTVWIWAALIIGVAALAAGFIAQRRRGKTPEEIEHDLQMAQIERLLEAVRRQAEVLSAQVIENLSLGTPLKPELMEKVPLDELRHLVERDAPALRPEVRGIAHALSGLAQTVMPVLLHQPVTQEWKNRAVVEATTRYSEISHFAEAAERKLGTQNTR